MNGVVIEIDPVEASLRIPAASDVFEGATSQRDVDARVGDFVALLEDHGYVVDVRGTVTYDPAVRPASWIAGWSLRRVREDKRSFALLGFKPWLRKAAP